MKLVIAEKPSVARSIAGVIGATEKHDGYLQGNGYLVSWCIGHLVSFADAGRYDERFRKWRYEDLPILPETWQYIIPDEKKQQFDILRSLMERPDVTGLICATDAGREGELIFRFVYQMAGCKKPFKRLWISSMEDSAIRDGFAHLKPGTDYDPLYQSALCRAKADWLVGINATRLFSVLYHKTLTVGRVQTPTLNLLVERDAKITNFKKEKYHIVHIGVGDADAVSSRFSDAAEANTVKAACAGAQAVCASVTRDKKTEQPPKLYDLTTLQREANRLFGFTAKQTLDYAQTLYEKKLLQQIGITADNPQDFFINGYSYPEGQCLALPYDMVLAADVDELNFLAAQLGQLDAAEIAELNAVLQNPKGGFASIGQIIDFTENVDYYVHLPDVHSAAALGDYYLNRSGMVDMPQEWKVGIDTVQFGRHISQQEQGAFTEYGYIVKSGDEWQRVHEGQPVPEEYRVMAFPQPEVMRDEIKTRQAAVLTAEAP